MIERMPDVPVRPFPTDIGRCAAKIGDLNANVVLVPNSFVGPG
jgi:hypothetical protein